MKKNKNKSKSKGKNGERELCSIFKKHFGENYNFMRVPNSGSYLGGLNSTNIDKMESSHINLLQGDLIMPDDFKNILVEVKYYRDFSFHSLINSNKNFLFDSWIEQILKTNNNKIWFLCIKINRKGWFISFDNSLKDKFILNNYIKYKSSVNNVECIITDLENFILNNKNRIINLSREK